MFGGNFAPRHWALCNGQLLSISEHDTLYALLGTVYGGDGRTTFALPDMRGRLPVGEGTGTGLTPRTQGARYGRETVTLDTQTMPYHQHRFQASTDLAEVASPANMVLAKMKEPTTTFYEDIDNVPEDEVKPFVAASVHAAGGSDPHDNMMPYLAITYIIALRGVFPSRN
jgi:microcystin-dependent protein